MAALQVPFLGSGLGTAWVSAMLSLPPLSSVNNTACRSRIDLSLMCDPVAQFTVPLTLHKCANGLIWAASPLACRHLY